MTLIGGSNTTLGDTTVFTYTIQDDDTAPEIQFTETAVSGSESFQTIDLAIELSAVSGKDITIDFAITGGTATGTGVDYAFPTTSLTIPAGSQTDSLQLSVIDDFFEESNETFIVTLQNPVNTTIGTNASLTYTILDNDGISYKGPGGIGNLTTQTVLWLRTTTAPGNSDGNPVTTWQDQSDNGNDATQSSAALKPTFLENVWNSRPVISFNGTDVLGIDDTPDINTGGPYDRKTILVAFRTSTDITTRQVIYEEGGGVRGLNIYIDNDSLYIGGYNNSDDDGGQTTPWPNPGPPTNYLNYTKRPLTANSNNFLVMQFDFDLEGTAFNGDVRAGLNGEEPLVVVTGAGRLFSHPGDIGIGGIRNSTVFHDGSQGSGAYYNGNLGELIVNNVVYNTAQIRIVNNYLAAKYNISIPNDIYDHQLNHSYEVFGIGQIDADNFHNDAMGSGIIRMDNPSSMDNGDFMLIGHDDGSISWSSAEVPDNNTTNFRRLTREWRADETGDIGNVRLMVDTAALDAPPFGFTANYILMLDDDGDFTADATIYQMSYQGNGFYGVSNVDLSGNKYFSVGLANAEVEFTLAEDNNGEPVTAYNLEVSLNYNTATAVTVDYTITGGTATGGGTDYTRADGTATITAGNRTVNIPIVIVNDTDLESDETIIITLSNPSSGTVLGSNTVFTYTINDDDNPRKILFSRSDSTNTEDQSPIVVEVFLNSRDDTNDTSVDYIVTGGSATGSGTDYTLASGTVTIVASANPEDTTGTFSIVINDDAIDEADETIQITLQNPVNTNLGDTTVYTYTIQDDDTQPSVQFSTTTSGGIESITAAYIIVELSAASGQDIDLDYSLDGTGTTATNGGIDFDLQAFSITIPAGQTTDTIQFSIYNDAIIEGEEYIEIDLDGATNASLGTNLTHTYTISDDDSGLGILGPGGVAGEDATAFWLRADADVYNDAGTTLATDTQSALQWNDQGENLLNADTMATGSEPTYYDGASGQAVNSRPVLLFDGSNDGFTIADDDLINDRTSGYSLKCIGVVFKASTTDVTSRQVIFEQGNKNDGLNIFIEGGNLHFGAWDGDITYIEVTNSISTSDVVFAVLEYDQVAGEIRAYVNGTLVGKNAGVSTTLDRHRGDVGIGAMHDGSRYSTASGDKEDNDGRYFDGKIMELFELDERNLNSAQRKLIGSYIEAKYGITVSDNQYSYAATHSYEVFGIGRDYADSLHASARGSGLILFDSPTSLGNGDFLLAGHDNGSMASFSTTGAPNNPFIEKISRTWKVDEVGDIGNLRISVDTTLLPSPNAGFEEYFLLMDNDNDGDFTDTGDGSFQYIHLNARYGAYARATNIDLNAGDIFTITMAQNVAINDGSWTNPSTWLIKVPSSDEVAYLNAEVTLPADVSVQALTILTGATLNLSTFSLTLNAGTLTNNGTFNEDFGTMQYANNSGSVCIPGDDQNVEYYNLLISGNGTKVLCSDVTVNNDLEITGGPTLDTDSGNDYGITLSRRLEKRRSLDIQSELECCLFCGR